MSELIEKFSGRFAIYQNQTFVFELTIDEISAIISALETVLGIEEIAKEADLTLNIHPPLIDCHESCEDVRWLVEIDGSGFNAPTLSAAVEAAKKGM